MENKYTVQLRVLIPHYSLKIKFENKSKWSKIATVKDSQHSKEKQQQKLSHGNKKTIYQC
jgi:hypothetical protein